MDNTHCRNINNSKPKICKQLWILGDKYLIIIDKSIIEKLGITENSIIFLEQEITDDKTILMKIKNYGIDVDQQRVGSSLNNKNDNY